MIKKFQDDYGVFSGLSDHTMGVVAPVMAISQGAKIIEKHFILDRELGGPDSSFSLNVEENALRFPTREILHLPSLQVPSPLREEVMHHRAVLAFVEDDHACGLLEIADSQPDLGRAGEIQVHAFAAQGAFGVG